MKICLIGKNLSNVVLASVLANKKLAVDIIYDSVEKKKFPSRTLGISKSNFIFLNNINKKYKISAWPVDKIKIFCEDNEPKELFEFNSQGQENFFLVKYDNLYKYFFNSLKSYKNIKFIKFKKKISQKYLYKSSKYNLIINSDVSNEISKKFFFKKVEKRYGGCVYTGIINHKKNKNNTAIQIFTKLGPLAFLPLSSKKTSIVFSFYNNRIIDQEKLIKLISKYNLNYKIISYEKFEKFNLKFSMLRNYYYKNILSFGDFLHKIHPLAGQGFNMTVRDIKILSDLIDERIKLGLDLDTTLLNDFQKKTKHKNYIFSFGIDFIHNFFKVDGSIKNSLSKPIFNVLNNNKYLNKYATLFADKGFNI